jgi:periplasmic copper chaperone A
MTAFRSPLSRRRPAAVIGAGVALTAGLVLAAPLAASAHVTVSPEAGTAGGYSVLTFAFSHGCDGSPTTQLAIDVPDGIASLAPEIEPGWTIERVGAEAGIPTQLIYTPDAPIESGLRAALNVQVSFAEDAAGETLAFPVVQTCAEGQTDWVEIPEAGQDPHALDAPAPVVTVGAAEEDGGHDHASADAASGEQASDAHASPADGSVTDVLPVVLGGVALALGLGALVASVIALRRTRRP